MSLPLGAALGLLLAAACAVPTSPSAPASPSAPEASSPATSGGSETACPDPQSSGSLPFDRLVRVEVGSVPGADVVTFSFGPPLQAGARSNAELSEIRPPFVQGASGLPLEVGGTSFVWVKFDALLLFDDTGKPALESEREFRPDLPVVRHAVNSEEFEGVSSWIVGYRGPACVRLETDLVGRVVRLSFGYAVF